MASKKKNTAQIISLDAFGSAKDYWLCWVQSPLTHFSFAVNVQKHFDLPCTYIGNILLEDVHPDLKFPMYLTNFNMEYDVNMVILANHVTAPTALSMDQQNPLLGGLLFEDEYFLNEIHNNHRINQNRKQYNKTTIYYYDILLDNYRKSIHSNK